jgi:isopenicillin-N N-acyltransferase-like protein
MKRRLFFKKSAQVLAGVSAGCLIPDGWKRFSSVPNMHLSHSSDKETIKVIELRGTPQQRGQIHGEALRDKISELIEIWKGDLRANRKMDPDACIDDFLDNTQFVKAIKKWTPDLLDEVKGIAEGSGIDYKTIFAFQVGEEEGWYARRKESGASGGPFPIASAEKCSGLGVCGQEGLPALVAQNQDYTLKDGNEALLHIKHNNSSLESYVFTLAGLIAILPGMNNSPLGICANALPQLAPRPDGLPVAFIARGVLERRSFRDAVKFIHGISHATGQNYIIGGPEEVGSFECSANKVSRFVPYPGANRVYHTNHVLVNDDLDNTLDENSVYGGFLPNTQARFQALEKRLKDPKKTITVATAKEALSSHDDPKFPVCRHTPKPGGVGFTAGCGVAELTDPPVFHFAPGPPCSTEFKTYTFGLR